MKIRQGFVSNSSSSNFVVLGYAFPEGIITREQFQELMDYNEDDLYEGPIVFSKNWGVNDGDNEFIGVSVCNNEDYGLAEYGADVAESEAKLKEAANKLGIPEQYRKLRAISGSRPT